MTYKQVKEAWFSESFDLVHATPEQIDHLCEEIQCGDPAARYEDYQEELRCLMAEF